MITDWDDAYANGAHIDGSDAYPDGWRVEAARFRQLLLSAGRADLDIAYGTSERERFDAFYPESESRGLVIFAHGGYWRSFDKTYWSHLAAGAVARGWTVSVPSYRLAPDARISEITREFSNAVIVAAGRVPGPVRLAGHSAGGHLVARMLSRETLLPDDVRRRIQHVVSISGLHDLRPLMRTKINETLRLDMEEARAESPALHHPVEAARLTCWVGSNERPEFIRQNDLLANIWTGLGASTSCVHAQDRHHFDIIDALADPASDLVGTLLG